MSSKKAIINRIKDGSNRFSTGTKFKAAAAAVSTPFILGEYGEDKEEKGTGRAMVEGLATAAAIAVAPPLLLAGGVAVGAAAIGIDKAIDVGKKLVDIDKQYQRVGTSAPFSSARFFETRETFTMRQAGMAAIGQARGSLEHYMMGNEAQLLR